MRPDSELLQSVGSDWRQPSGSGYHQLTIGGQRIHPASLHVRRRNVALAITTPTMKSAILLLAFPLIQASAQQQAGDANVRSAAARRAIAAGILRDLELAAARLRLGEPTPEYVIELADSTKRNIQKLLRDGARSERWLGIPLGVGSFLIKAGQYVGGGGALFFGFNAADPDDPNSTAGRNAAYAGGLAAGVTFMEDVFQLDEVKERVVGCRELRIQEAALIGKTDIWKYKRNDEVFRRGLEAEHTALVADLTALYRKCVEPK